MPERVTWVGHATVLVEMDGVRLLTDPFLRARLGHIRRHAAPPAAGVAERIDAVLISHAHADHLDVPSLRRLGRDAVLVVPRGAARVVRRLSFAQTAELAAGDHIEIGPLTIPPGHHQLVFHPVEAPLPVRDATGIRDPRLLSFELGTWSWAVRGAHL